LVLQLLSLVFNVWGGSHTNQPMSTANGHAQVSGRIVDRLGCPMIATVRLRAPVDHTLQEVRSDMEGRFTFPDVAAGHYWIAYDLQPSAGAGGDVVDVTDAATYKEVRWPEPDRQTWDGSVVVTDSEGTALSGVGVTWRRYSGGVNG